MKIFKHFSVSLSYRMVRFIFEHMIVQVQFSCWSSW